MTDTDETGETTRTDSTDGTMTDSGRHQRRNGEHSISTADSSEETTGDRSGSKREAGVPAVAPPGVQEAAAEAADHEAPSADVDAAWGERFRGSGTESLTSSCA